VLENLFKNRKQNINDTGIFFYLKVKVTSWSL